MIQVTAIFKRDGSFLSCAASVFLIPVWTKDSGTLEPEAVDESFWVLVLRWLVDGAGASSSETTEKLLITLHILWYPSIILEEFLNIIVW